VGDVDEGGADPPLHRLELALDLPPQGHVEGAERLVEEQHGRLDRQRPGERHALALPARELVHPAAGEAVEPDQG
jgi:hypothetical protein